VFSVGLAGIAGVLLGGCGGSSSSSNGPAVAQVTQAAYVTSHGPGFKMALTMSADIGGEPFSLTTVGAFDEGERRGSMSETVDGKTVAVIMDLPYGYVQASGKLIKGKPWARFDVEGLSQSLGVGAGSLDAGGDPSQWIEFLKAAGQASTVGSETLRGVPTTHYHVMVDLARLPAVVPARLRAEARQRATVLERISGQSNLAIDVWIDASKRVRRYQVQVPFCFKGERTSESVSTELYDYGTQTVRVPPPLSETVDLTKEIDASASRGLAEVQC